ncbi:MAG TPA: RNA-guided endonuclease TnpB family protein [Anaerolineales bacterium]
MIIRKAFRYRLYPTAEQEQALAVQFGHARFVWNWALALRKITYQETGKGIGYYELKRRATALKHQAETEWLQEADSQVLQGKIEDLERAYKNFFEKRAKFPRFKSKRDGQSIRYPQRFKFDENSTYLPKVGWVKTKFHRPLEGRPKNVTVSKTKTGKYFVSVQCEMEMVEPPVKSGEIGIDLGVQSFLTTSEGWKRDNPRHLQQAERKLIRLQRQLSRRVKGSAGRERARNLLAHQHERVANQRRDFLQKLSTELVGHYGLIGMEDLNVRGLVKNRRLAKAIAATGWGAFGRMLEYKGEWYSSYVHKVDRFFPSSKTCNHCGYVLDELPLSAREWQCPISGTIHDRDINSAINILNETRAGVARSHAGGESVRWREGATILAEAESLAASPHDLLGKSQFGAGVSEG